MTTILQISLNLWQNYLKTFHLYVEMRDKAGSSGKKRLSMPILKLPKAHRSKNSPKIVSLCIRSQK